MKAVIVRYRIREDFIPKNCENIAAVLAEHRELAHPGVRYFASQEKGDPQSFVHIGVYADDAALQAAGELGSFRVFQNALRNSDPLEAPDATWIDPIEMGFAFPA
jgi:quinol monooxygenase YgiN